MRVKRVDPAWEWQIAFWLGLGGLLVTPTWPVHDEPVWRCPLCKKPHAKEHVEFLGFELNVCPNLLPDEWVLIA